jgi:hypothetical protein
MLKTYHGFGSSDKGVLVTAGHKNVFAYSYSPAMEQFYLFTSAHGYDDNHTWVQITGRTAGEYEQIIARKYGPFNIGEMIKDAIGLTVAEFGPGLSQVLLQIARKSVGISRFRPLAIDPLDYAGVCTLVSDIEAEHPRSMIKVGQHSFPPRTIIGLAQDYRNPNLVHLVNNRVDPALIPQEYVGQADLILNICATMYSGPSGVGSAVDSLMHPEGVYIEI